MPLSGCRFSIEPYRVFTRSTDCTREDSDSLKCFPLIVIVKIEEQKSRAGSRPVADFSEWSDVSRAIYSPVPDLDRSFQSTPKTLYMTLEGVLRLACIISLNESLNEN